jgi:hypothetical protein
VLLAWSSLANVAQHAGLTTNGDVDNKTVFRYRLYDIHGSEQGELEYPVPVEPGDTFWTSDGRPLRALDLSRPMPTRISTRAC